MAESLSPKKPETEEILQFLKREEVRTMAKDVALLREEEAKKERERIAKIKTEEPKKEAKPLLTPQPVLQTREETKPKPSLMPHVQGQKPIFLRTRTHSEKILIRVIVIGILLFILLNGLVFSYWYFTRKKGAEITSTPQSVPSENQISPVESNLPLPENKPSVSSTPIPLLFFEPVQNKIIAVAATDNIPSLLSGALQEEYPLGFTRILVQETGSTRSLTTKEFLTKTTIVVPESLLSLFKDDFMLFAYSSPGKKRLGIIVELSQIADTEQGRSTEGVQGTLKSWEATLEQDTKPFWEILGQKGSAYTPFFRQTVYQNIVVRFQTFSVIDFGIVYALTSTKLILATSFESLTRTVDQLLQSK